MESGVPRSFRVVWDGLPREDRARAPESGPEGLKAGNPGVDQGASWIPETGLL